MIGLYQCIIPMDQCHKTQAIHAIIIIQWHPTFTCHIYIKFTKIPMPCVASSKPWALYSPNTECSLQLTACHCINIHIHQGISAHGVVLWWYAPCSFYILFNQHICTPMYGLGLYNSSFHNLNIHYTNLYCCHTTVVKIKMIEHLKMVHVKQLPKYRDLHASPPPPRHIWNGVMQWRGGGGDFN